MVFLYGIPGYMTPLEKKQDFTSVSDPAPEIEKQIIAVDKYGVTIEYEQNHEINKDQTLVLPHWEGKAQNFVFYCHTPNASVVHTNNYHCFLTHTWPEVKNDSDFLIVISHNVTKDFGFQWLSDNTILIRRPNIGLDFGAHTDALHFTGLHNRSPADLFYVFFLNDTVYGPTFPWWIKPRPKWTAVFRNMLTHDVKLAGMSINPFFGVPHVQSMMMVCDNVGLRIGIKAQVFACRRDKAIIIKVSEVGFSTAILAAGFNIDCAAELLHGFDYRKKDQIPKQVDDVTFDNMYFNKFSVHPFETIFSKTVRMNAVLSHLLLQHSLDKP